MGIPSKLWCGRIYGTNTGNVFLEITNGLTDIDGHIHFNDDKFGLSRVAFKGKFSNDKLYIEGDYKDSGGTSQKYIVDATLEASGELNGVWRSSNGAAGTVRLCSHENRVFNSTNNPKRELGVFTKTVGVITLFKSDLADIASELVRGFNNDTIIISIREDNLEKRFFFPIFPNDFPTAFQTNYLRMYISESDGTSDVKWASIEFFAQGTNIIQVQSSDTNWARGKGEAIFSKLKRLEVKIASIYKQHGLYLNSIIFFILLILLPSLPTLAERAQVGVVIFGVLQVLFYLYHKVVPVFSYNNQERKENIFSKLIPYYYSLAVTIVGGLVVLLVYDKYFKGL